MKNQLTLTNAVTRLGRCGLVLAGVTLLAMAASSSAAEVLPPSSLPYGLSYEEWSAKWWQWSLGQSTNHLEMVGWSGVCTGPASRVQFLAGVYLPGAGGVTTETRKVRVSEDTPLFFTILSAWVDNSGCPTFTSFTADQLAAQAAAQWSAVTTTSCIIDGVPVAGLENPATTPYLVQAPPFSYTTAEKDNVLAGFFGEPCIPGGMTIYPAVADGVYLMLAPLSRGKHTIHFVGAAAPFLENDITYDITVERD
jgi:hypothetical protein